MSTNKDSQKANNKPAEFIFLIRVEVASHESIQEHNDRKSDDLAENFHL